MRQAKGRRKWSGQQLLQNDLILQGRMKPVIAQNNGIPPLAACQL
jgi:hypothetical protein